MTKSIRTTKLDGELLSISRAPSPVEALRNPVSLAALGELGVPSFDVGEEPNANLTTPVDLATVKLSTRSGSEQVAAQWVTEHGGRVVSQGSRVLVAELPASQIGPLGEAEWLRRAEAPRPLLPLLDQARGPATGLDLALTKHSLSGQGVVVGVIDTGVDWRHPDFRADDGSTRLEMFAHARFVPQPNGNGTHNFKAFSRAEIDAALQGASGVPAGDPNGHGTHCACIAAGDGRGLPDGRFRGVAHSATLMAVRSDGLFDNHVIEGIRQIFARATQASRPAVISLSLGGHLGAHDGTSALENVIAAESGPGRIVVVAAGNEGQDRIHFQGDLRNGEVVIPVQITDAAFQFVDVWVMRGDEVDVFIETPDGTQHVPDDSGGIVQGPFGAFLATPREDELNRDQNLTLRIAQAQVGATWRIRIVPISISQGIVHAWAGTRQAATSRGIFPPGDPGFSLGMPGTEERAVVVGSFVSRTSFAGPTTTTSLPGLVAGRLSSFSSRGPSRYGALKPDIAAPGQVITAALAAGSSFSSDPNLQARLHSSGRYITIQGTSMATPFVAGIIALMLERNPRLTPEEVQQRLRVTARRDADTGLVWNPGFGFGKLDVEALLDYSRALDALP